MASKEVAEGGEGRLTWGTRVQVATNAPVSYRPGSLGEICGIPDPSRADDDLYLVEFADGQSLTVPERWLTRDD
jgi:hypothetical protein